MLTKSKLLAWLQCPKRLWLEAHAPSSTPPPANRLAQGRDVGAVARRLFADDGVRFEAPFGDDVLAVRADVARLGPDGWDLIEVKATARVKDHHLADAAIQLAAARRAGDPPARAFVAHIDSGWTYPGGGDYRGLLTLADVTAQAQDLADEVDGWIDGALATLAGDMPARATGAHCEKPYLCGFHAHCRAAEPVVERPIDWLPRPHGAAIQARIDAGARSMDDLPDEILNDRQRWVKTQTLLGTEWFDRAAAAARLAACAAPLHFLDFETVNMPVPIWPGTRPFAQIPFQFSLHLLDRAGRFGHRQFLMTSGEDPSRLFAEALVDAVEPHGAVVTYNGPFERSRILELAGRFPDLAPRLTAIAARLFDLLPVARDCYYHPDQHGRWGLKAVLPCLVPELRYDALDGVRDGGMASDAYLEMIDPACPGARRAELEVQLKRYCRLDTLALIGLWARFAGDDDLLAEVIAAEV